MTRFFISPPFGNYLDLKKTTSIKGSFTLYPRDGLITRILLSLRYSFSKGGWINKIGLRNPGIDYAIEKYKDNKDCIISVAILEQSEIVDLVRKIPPDMNLELNVSCPNVTYGNVAGGNVDKSDLEFQGINSNLHYFLNDKREWCIVKVSPFTDMKLIDSYYEKGFRQFHCSNTIPLEDGSGGLSGKSIIPFNKKLIPEIKKKYPDTTVIAGGGITSYNDIMNYHHIGSDNFAFSTVFFNPIRAYMLYKDLDKAGMKIQINDIVKLQTAKDKANYMKDN